MTDVANAVVLLLNFVIVPGVAYGSQLALGALGVTLVFGILRFANFAHGDVMALGTMVVLLTTWWFQGMGIGISPLPTALLALSLRDPRRSRLQPGCGPCRLPFLPAAQEPGGDPAYRLGRRDVLAAGHRPLHHRPRRPAPRGRSTVPHQGLRVQGCDRAAGRPRAQGLAGADRRCRRHRGGRALLVPVPDAGRQGNARLFGQRGSGGCSRV